MSGRRHNSAEDPVTSPPRRQSFSQFAGIARSDSQSAGIDHNYLQAQRTLRPYIPNHLRRFPRVRTRTGSTESSTGSRLSSKNLRATSLGCSLRAATMVVRDSPISDRCGVPGRGWSYRRATAVVISRVSGAPTLTWCQGRQAFHNQRSRAWRDSPFDTRLISASVRWRTEGFRLRRPQPKAGCSAPEIVRRTANLAQSYY
ncbi:hypothetical protein ACVWW2_002052 [Bradyrhizobium sp. LM4.3]